MKTYPAIALIEYASVASGVYAGDTMVKKAPISVIKCGTVHNGKYLMLIGGSVASVEESYAVGLTVCESCVLDNVILPDIHNQLHDGLLGRRIPCTEDALGIIETSTVASMLGATDAGVKGANVNIVEIRMANDLGGKALTLLNGKLEEVEAAVSIAKDSVTNSDLWVRDKIIPRLHNDMRGQINRTTHFARVTLRKVEGSEI